MPINHRKGIEWMNKLCYSHTMECYVAMRMSDINLNSTIWMNLINIILSEKSQHKVIQIVYLYFYVVQRHAKLCIRSHSSNYPWCGL